MINLYPSLLSLKKDNTLDAQKFNTCYSDPEDNLPVSTSDDPGSQGEFDKGGDINYDDILNGD